MEVEALVTVAVVEVEALATVALPGGLELQISFFSTTVTTSSDSSLVSRPLRCKMKCFVVRTNLKKKRRIIYVMLMSFCVLVTFGENSMASGLRC